MAPLGRKIPEYIQPPSIKHHKAWTKCNFVCVLSICQERAKNSSAVSITRRKDSRQWIHCLADVGSCSQKLWVRRGKETRGIARCSFLLMKTEVKISFWKCKMQWNTCWVEVGDRCWVKGHPSPRSRGTLLSFGTKTKTSSPVLIQWAQHTS